MTRPTLPALALASMLAACTTTPSAVREAGALAEAGRPEEAIATLRAAAKARPGDVAIRTALARESERTIGRLVAQGDAARAVGDAVSARTFYDRALAVEPGNARAAAGLAALATAERHAAAVLAAETQFRAGNLPGAETTVRAVLAENPSQRDARALARRIADRDAQLALEPKRLGAAMARTVSLEFRDAPLRAVFDLLSRSAGINFVFDRDVRQDVRTSIFVKDVSVDDVLRLLLATNQLERRVMNENSVLVYPNTAAKQREYQELVTRTFYLTNADVKSALAMVKALVKTRDVFIDEKLNAIIVKDTPDAVRYAERLLAAQDLAEPEVMLEVEVLEVVSSRLEELGMRFPEQLSYGAFGPSTSTTGAATSGLLPSPVPLQRDTNFRVAIANPALILNLRNVEGAANVLANPRIRVRNRDKAKIHIGEKVPVFTSTATANVGVTSAVNYLDVGLKLEVEPAVLLDEEVGIKVGLEVSSILSEVQVNNTLAYRLGTRTTATSLRLRDGETQVLAGLIRDEDRRTTNRIPGIGELPLVGRLFSNNLGERVKTEIVLLITPRVVRNIARPEAHGAQIHSGTDANPGAAGMTLRSATGSLALASLGGGAAGAPPAPSAPPPPPAREARPAPTSLGLVMAAPGQVRTETEFALIVGIPPVDGGARGRFELVFDPERLQATGLPPGAASSAPGRIAIDVAQPAEVAVNPPAEVRFRAGRVLGPTEIRLEGATARDTAGAPIAVGMPPPQRVIVTPP